MTVEGFVFRVDMRLRPYGDSGVLVCNLPSLEEYYQTQGRDWERFAMIKARLVGAILPTRITDQKWDKQVIIESASGQLNSILQSFTYRKYVDFSVIESLRQLMSAPPVYELKYLHNKFNFTDTAWTQLDIIHATSTAYFLIDRQLQLPQ